MNRRVIDIAASGVVVLIRSPFCRAHHPTEQRKRLHWALAGLHGFLDRASAFGVFTVLTLGFGTGGPIPIGELNV